MNKKVLGVLVSTAALATAGVVAGHKSPIASHTVQAATIASGSYGVDVASYQSTDLSAYARNGAKFAIVKLTEGTNYQNPNARGQIASAKANGMLPMAYHFAAFSSNANTAVAEANYAIASARSMGLGSGAYLAIDWESSASNAVNGNSSANTAAIMAFMRTVKAAGYQPLLYSGAYLLRNNINTASVTAAYPNSIWVASYPYAGATSSADMDYFPSMDGVIIWQFTSNWNGQYVDANINVLPLNGSSSYSQAPAERPSKPAVDTSLMGKTSASGSPVAKILYQRSNIAVWSQPGVKTAGKYLAPNTSWKVFKKTTVNGKTWYNLGGNQWISGEYCYVTGVNSIPTVSSATSKPASSTSSASAASTTGVVNFSAVGRINYVPGYGIMVWNNYGASAKTTGKYLKHGTNWKIFKKATMSDGSVWYNVGGNQWVDGKYIVLK